MPYVKLARWVGQHGERVEFGLVCIDVGIVQTLFFPLSLPLGLDLGRPADMIAHPGRIAAELFYTLCEVG